jgi:hypothetical protein
MERYRQNEIESILKLFEKELANLNRLTRIEKMKIRKRVTSSIIAALSESNSKPDAFLNIVELKLRDVLNMFFDSWGFRENLRRQVSIINKRPKADKKRRAKIIDRAENGAVAGGE